MHCLNTAEDVDGLSSIWNDTKGQSGRQPQCVSHHYNHGPIGTTAMTNNLHLRPSLEIIT